MSFRPTRLHAKMYTLIFNRFMASMSRESRIRKARLLLRPNKDSMLHEIEVVVGVDSNGFTMFYGPRVEEWASGLAKGDKLKILEARLYRSSSVKLYTSGDVIKLMRDRGIGRPSTYSKAIEANMRHGYVVESRKRKYLVPTKLGTQVYSYLSSRFNALVSEETSRALEELLDMIERGEIDPYAALEAVKESIEAQMGRPLGHALLRAKAGTAVIIDV